MLNDYDYDYDDDEFDYFLKKKFWNVEGLFSRFFFFLHKKKKLNQEIKKLKKRRRRRSSYLCFIIYIKYTKMELEKKEIEITNI